MATNEIIGALSDRGILQRIGREIADGMRQSGGSSIFSPENTTGRGTAGGRGDGISPRSQTELLKAKQLEEKYSNQITKSFKMLNRELDAHRKGTSASRSAIMAYSNALGKSWSEAMEHVAKSKASEDMLIRKLNASLSENIKSMDDVIRIRERQQKLEKNILDRKTITTKEEVEEHKRLTKALGESSVGLDDFGKSLADNAKRVVRGFFSLEAAMANLSIAAKQLTTDFRAQLRFGSQMGLFANQLEAIRLGIDPATFTEINAQARQASLTFGSMSEFTEDLRTQQMRYFNQIGDLTETTRFTAQTFQLLGRSGIRPSIQAMDSLGDSFRVLNKIAGMSSDQFAGMMDSVLADEDITAKLRAAKEGERQAIVAGIARQIEMNTAMGMTVEQATEAARAMGRLGGGSARERFKQAAMTQATMGAMGIAGGAEAADLIRKGQRRTSAENERLQELMGRVSNAASEAQRGGYGAEMMVDTLMDKSQMGQYLGPNSPFNTNLTNGLAANKTVLEQIRDKITDQLTGGEKMLMLVDKVTNFVVNGALGKILIGVAQLIGAYVIAGKAAGLISRVLPGAATAATTATTAAGATTAAAQGSRLATMGKVARVGGAATAAAYGVYQAGQAITTGRSDVHDALVSTSIGQKISDGIGSGIAHTLAFFGNDAAQEAIAMQEATRAEQAKAATAAEAVVTPTTETAEATKKTATTMEQLLELTRVSVEMQANAVEGQVARDRLSRMRADSQTAMLYN